jgi:hypothetical protein
MFVHKAAVWTGERIARVRNYTVTYDWVCHMLLSHARTVRRARSARQAPAVARSRHAGGAGPGGRSSSSSASTSCTSAASIRPASVPVPRRGYGGTAIASGQTLLFFCGLQIDRAGHWGASSLWACLLGKRGCLLALRHYFARDDENHGRMLSLYFTFRTGDPVVGWHLRRLCSCACCSGRSSRDARGHANGPRTSHSKISA